MIIHRENGGRASGNTFRSVLRALLSMSEGKKVVYVSSNRLTADDAAHQLNIILKGRKGFTRPSRFKFTYPPSGGSVEFRTLEGTLSGRRPEVAILDVYSPGLSARERTGLEYWANELRAPGTPYLEI